VKTVFLDRDGVINRNCKNDYFKNWDEFEFLPNSLRAIQHLTDAGHRLIVVTNQSCINKGIVASRTLDEIHQRMVSEIERASGRIHAIYYCPHRDDEGCGCRKPKPGLLIQAAHEHAIDLSRSYLVGDSMRDIAAGQQVGCRAFLVLTGNYSRVLEKQTQNATSRENFQPERIFADLYGAAIWILEESD
jgi:D-glycero-D-manno-heptose 1,7-bisphosphate phosphatase